MPRIDDAVSITRDGIILSVEVTAGSKMNRFPAGFNPWRTTILCRVTAPPLEGRANVAVLELLAETLDVPVSALQIRAGATSPIKKIGISGKTKPDLVKELTTLMQ